MPKRLLRAKQVKFMNLNELQKLINHKGERVIIVEGDKPTLVVLSFQDYQAVAGLASQSSSKVGEAAKSKAVSSESMPLAESLPEPLPEHFPEVEEMSSESEPESLKDKSELTIEDLPF